MGRLVSYLPTALEEAHEIDVSPNGRREVKYPFAFKDLDWEAYHRFRPFYPDSMFTMWQVYLISYLLPYPSVSMVSWVRCQSTLLDISQWARLGGLTFLDGHYPVIDLLLNSRQVVLSSDPGERHLSVSSRRRRR